MENHLFISIILLLLMEEGHMTQATFIQNVYKKTESGQNITGKVGAEIGVQSAIECSTKCAGATKCETYQYNGTGPGNCLLIQPNCSDIEGPIFEQKKDGVIFEKVNSIDWVEPTCWTGPNAVYYQSFDGSDGLILMEGSQKVNQIPLVPGKVYGAWAFSGTRKQWLDLGIYTDSCMTRPETCGVSGGAISVWINLIECGDWDGVLSTRSDFQSPVTGSVIFCKPPVLRFWVYLLDGVFQTYPPRPTGWTHVVLNYIGPDNDQGIRIFYDGVNVGSDTTKNGELSVPADGRLVVGRFRTDQDSDYTSMQVDELIFFNQALSNDDINLLYAVA